MSPAPPRTTQDVQIAKSEPCHVATKSITTDERAHIQRYRVATLVLSSDRIPLLNEITVGVYLLVTYYLQTN